MKLGTAKLVDDAIFERVSKVKSRDYLGASILGYECDRQIWYMYKKPKATTDPRINRIFEFGHMLEDYVVKILRDSGLTVHCEDANGEQFGFTDGNIAGHIDGVITGLPESSAPHLLEIKSANDARFKQFVKNGCRETQISYWAQCQIYMHKFNLSRCLFVVINKNTSELYYERIEYSKKIAELYMTRGHSIEEATEEPMRKYNKSTHFKCRFCDYNKECWDVD